MDRVGDKGFRWIKSNLAAYIAVLFFFFIGLASGAYTAKALPSAEKADLTGYVVNAGALETHRGEAFWTSLSNNLKTFGLITLGSLFWLGSALVVISVLVRGFVLGFTVAVLGTLGAQGLGLSLIAVWLPNVLLVPILATFAVYALSTALGRKKGRAKTKPSLEHHLLICGLFFLSTLVVSVIEVYLVPPLMQLLV
ncbi:stage II sporulation protein M [Christensenellaceae bacterium NSJ-53]|uniref:Stage II sporulation protein M n=1 Tax=Gehongia tenuis TaxID=2763655 RepID=A0A926D6B0_9FIRM|nr:stage II sporulation protein M [Gehongia tenuis]MBC8531180.1 stage II sporulation protein M [Gehongia tenuis]